MSIARGRTDPAQPRRAAARRRDSSPETRPAGHKPRFEAWCEAQVCRPGAQTTTPDRRRHASDRSDRIARIASNFRRRQDPGARARSAPDASTWTRFHVSMRWIAGGLSCAAGAERRRTERSFDPAQPGRRRFARDQVHSRTGGVRVDGLQSVTTLTLCHSRTPGTNSGVPLPSGSVMSTSPEPVLVSASRCCRARRGGPLLRC